MYLTFLLSVLVHFQFFSKKWNTLHGDISTASFVGLDAFPGYMEIWVHAAAFCTEAFIWSEGRCGPGQVLYWMIRGQNPGPPCSIYNFVDLKHKTWLFEPKRIRFKRKFRKQFSLYIPQVSRKEDFTGTHYLHNHFADNSMLGLEFISEVSVSCEASHGVCSTASPATKGEN